MFPVYVPLNAIINLITGGRSAADSIIVSQSHTIVITAYNVFIPLMTLLKGYCIVDLSPVAFPDFASGCQFKFNICLNVAIGTFSWCLTGSLNFIRLVVCILNFFQVKFFNIMFLMYCTETVSSHFLAVDRLHAKPRRDQATCIRLGSNIFAVQIMLCKTKTRCDRVDKGAEVIFAALLL